ncbi:MAG: bifunctional adenosylcobinamide kinase/adenosylcobinamide-phosphate guanylyltransferase [Alphaproteobacteria bacterium]|nr:bifunctional adenosylcobinamide kinase/adenosylcobinamide-phosphate guanylyltransferase [Alphaproteobacteria bacterium]
MTSSPRQILLALGGARSGKSDYAENAALAMANAGQPHGAPRPLYYLATGQAFDGEMEQRIARHQDRRSAQFQTIEEPLQLAEVIARREAQDVIMIDSIGTWITNHMMAGSALPRVIDDTLDALRLAKGSVVLVSDEIGMGIVPDNAMSREFRDHIGMMNQGVASIANTVAFMVAGLPMIMKSEDQS